MKRFVSKVQNLSEKAAQIQQAIQSVPPKLSQIGESVAVTAGQLQQLRSTLQSSVTDLRMDNPDRILEALQEIHDSAGVFAEAGYDLRGIDMELSPVQRLIVHLDKLEDVAHPHIRSLITAHQNQKTVHALLSSLLQAEAVSDRVALSELSYRTLVINVGPIPSVRLCWRSDDAEEPSPTLLQPPGGIQAANPPQAPVQAATSSPFSQSSFFEARTLPGSVPAPLSPTVPPAVPVAAVAPAGTAAPHSSTSAAPVENAPAKDWKQEALDRLKKNPHASKYHS